MGRMVDCADKACRRGPWRSLDVPDLTVSGRKIVRRSVYHYSTLMLSFTVTEDGDWDGSPVVTSTGHGSVSDQQGMNKLFARLGMPLYFSRKGGASVEVLDGPQWRYGISKGPAPVPRRGCENYPNPEERRRIA